VDLNKGGLQLQAAQEVEESTQMSRMQTMSLGADIRNHFRYWAMDTFFLATNSKIDAASLVISCKPDIVARFGDYIPALELSLDFSAAFSHVV
jgi:hypothetical protein